MSPNKAKRMDMGYTSQIAGLRSNKGVDWWIQLFHKEGREANLNERMALTTETEQPEKLQERNNDFKAEIESGLAGSRLSNDL